MLFYFLQNKLGLNLYNTIYITNHFMVPRPTWCSGTWAECGVCQGSILGVGTLYKFDKSLLLLDRNLTMKLVKYVRSREYEA
jgi:hypothetical protein